MKTKGKCKVVLKISLFYFWWILDALSLFFLNLGHNSILGIVYQQADLIVKHFLTDVNTFVRYM